MRRGFSGVGMLVAANGEIWCLGTGSDATTEHETGAGSLMAALCGGSESPAEVLAADLKGGKLKRFPDLLEARRIKCRLDDIGFEERRVDGEATAVLYFSVNGGFDPWRGQMVSELRVSDRDEGFVGAWCNSGFAIKVVGEARCDMLRGFEKAMRDGRCVFAGDLLRDMPERPGGVVIAVVDYFQAEHVALIEQAQQRFEARVRLLSRSRLQELHSLERKHLPLGGVGYLWPVWRDGVVDGEVVYAINPGRNVKASYYGPHSFEELAAWIAGGARTHLDEVERGASAA